MLNFLVLSPPFQCFCALGRKVYPDCLRVLQGLWLEIHDLLLDEVLRSLDLWIKGCVKSRAFLLLRRACFPSPSARAPASQRTILSKNTSSSVQCSCPRPLRLLLLAERKFEISFRAKFCTIRFDYAQLLYSFPNFESFNTNLRTMMAPPTLWHPRLALARAD